MTDNTNPPRSANLPAGYDEDDPYEEIDIDELPEWWQQNVREFREYGLRPYRPPRFNDGELTPEVRSLLEEEFGIETRFRVVDPQERSEWEFWADDSLVATVERYRDGEGYTVYDIDSDRFERLVRNAVSES